MIKGIIPRLEEIGTVRIGKKGEERKSQKGTTYRLPEKLDYFMICTRQRDAAGNFIIDTTMHEKYGPEPRELQIRLLYDDINLNFQYWYVYYHGRKCVCKGDGEKAERKTQKGKEIIKCQPEGCQFFQEKKCKAFGHLQFILEGAHQVGGVYVYRTTSINTIVNIISSLTFLATRTAGILAGIPLKMTIRPKTVSPQGTSITTTVFVVNVIFDGTEEELWDLTIKMAKKRLQAGMSLKQLQARAHEMQEKQFEEEESIEEIVEEFYPETANVNNLNGSQTKKKTERTELKSTEVGLDEAENVPIPTEENLSDNDISQEPITPFDEPEDLSQSEDLSNVNPKKSKPSKNKNSVDLFDGILGG